MNLHFLPLYKNAAKIVKCLLSILQPTTRGLSCLDTVNTLILALFLLHLETPYLMLYTHATLLHCVSPVWHYKEFKLF